MKITISLGWSINSKTREKNREFRKKMTINRKRYNYQNLKLWTLGIEIVDDVYSVIKEFPAEEKFGLFSQISRSSISIPSNIAEGSSTDKSFANFLDIALGWWFELETELIIAYKRNFITE